MSNWHKEEIAGMKRCESRWHYS